MQWIWARGIYYPTLAWNIALGRLTHIRKWWHRVDDHLILGAVPLGNDIERLTGEKVTGVINTCEEYAGPVEQYEKLGVEQLWIPTIDFTPPTLEDIESAIEFIERHAKQDGSVYVHCKAGRGRSATIAVCWLMKTLGITPREAQEKLLNIRPHVKKNLYQRQVVQQFHEKLTLSDH